MMQNQQLLEYVKQQLQGGANREQIKSLLLANNWQEADINAAFEAVANNSVPTPESQMPQLVTGSLPGATALLSQAWSLYRQRFGTFLGVVAIPMLVLVVIATIPASLTPLEINSFLSEKLATNGIGFLIPILIASNLVFFTATFLVQSLGHTSLIFAIKDNSEGIGIWEAYRRGWRKIYSYWWIIFLVGFISLGGFLLLMIPGIIFAVWFSMAIFVLVAEDVRGMDALSKSREYVRGKWRQVCWRLFFIGSLSLIISLVNNFIFKFVNIPFGKEVGSFVLIALMTPLTMTYLFLLYANLKTMRGSFSFAPSASVGQKASFIFAGILGVLSIPALIALTTYAILGLAEMNERDSIRQTHIMQIQIELESYYSDHTKYPSTLAELPQEYSWRTVDPLTKQLYRYQLQADGQDYELCAQLEYTKTQKCVTSPDSYD